MGRSRGELTTKIHLLADRRSRSVVRVTTAGQRHDSLVFERLMNRLHIARTGLGRARNRGGQLLADKAYSTKKIGAHLWLRGITATIPEKADQIAHLPQMGSNGGRPPAFGPIAYKDRNTTERAFNKLKAFRAVARTDKRDYIFPGPSTWHRSRSGSAAPPGRSVRYPLTRGVSGERCKRSGF
ncbi:transposase [Haloechinothrix salitolerans]|uniref:Transposase n=1 Tax=Haloechinothrix salitolerans TaxID=926830 RepID=A0ABW2C3I6_9PSEU